MSGERVPGGTGENAALVRTMGGAVVHIASCSRKGYRTIPWDWASGRTLEEVEHEARTTGLGLCGSCTPLQALRHSAPFEYHLSEGEQLTIPLAIGQIIGAASMCWSQVPRGVFDSTRAAALAKQLEQTINELACRGDGSTVGPDRG